MSTNINLKNLVNDNPSVFDPANVFLVSCTYDDVNLPGYNAIAAPDWMPEWVEKYDDYRVLYAPFSPNAPGRVGFGAGETSSWMIVEFYPAEENELS